MAEDKAFCLEPHCGMETSRIPQNIDGLSWILVLVHYLLNPCVFGKRHPPRRFRHLQADPVAPKPIASVLDDLEGLQTGVSIRDLNCWRPSQKKICLAGWQMVTYHLHTLDLLVLEVDNVGIRSLGATTSELRISINVYQCVSPHIRMQQQCLRGS